MTDSTNLTPADPGTKKSAPVGMIAVAIMLALALIYLVYIYFGQKNQMVEMETALTQ
jgi:hypothetical protein